MTKSIRGRDVATFLIALVAMAAGAAVRALV